MESEEEGRGQRQPPWVAELAQLLTALGPADMKVNNKRGFLVSSLSNSLPDPGSAGNSRHAQWRQIFPGDTFHDDPLHA